MKTNATNESTRLKWHLIAKYRTFDKQDSFYSSWYPGKYQPKIEKCRSLQCISRWQANRVASKVQAHPSMLTNCKLLLHLIIFHVDFILIRTVHVKQKKKGLLLQIVLFRLSIHHNLINCLEDNEWISVKRIFSMQFQHFHMCIAPLFVILSILCVFIFIFFCSH